MLDPESGRNMPPHLFKGKGQSTVLQVASYAGHSRPMSEQKKAGTPSVEAEGESGKERQAKQKLARAERQAAALRANLKRRKEQAREKAKAHNPDSAKSAS